MLKQQRPGGPAMDERVACHGRTTFKQCTGGHVGEVADVEPAVGGYAWKCGKCGVMNHEYTNDACQFVGFWHPHLGHNPVYIDSWKTYRRELQKIGAHNSLAD